MEFVDLSGNSRLPIFLEMARSLGETVDPKESLTLLTEAMGKAYPPRGIALLTQEGLAPGYFRLLLLVTEKGVAKEARDPFAPDREVPPRSGGLLGRLIESPEPKLLHDLDVPDDPVAHEHLAGYRSALAVPVYDGGALWAWVVRFHTAPKGFDEHDVEDTFLRANLVGASLHNQRLARELEEAQRRTQREIERIAGIQRALLPERVPRVPGLQIATSYQTYDRAGGDFYDVWPLRRGADGESLLIDGPWGLLVADASGHGPSAAVVVAMLQAILHAGGFDFEEPAPVLEHLNRQIYAKRIEHSFVTAVFAVYDPASRTLRYARAGHNPPLLRHPRDDSVEALTGANGLPLGVVPDGGYEQAALPLESGQTLLFYTDGITETRSPDGILFGEEGIERALGICREEDAECVVRSIQATLRDYEGGGRPSDDQTMVAVRVL